MHFGERERLLGRGKHMQTHYMSENFYNLVGWGWSDKQVKEVGKEQTKNIIIQIDDIFILE
jgi:hypothetical protein